MKPPPSLYDMPSIFSSNRPKSSARLFSSKASSMQQGALSTTFGVGREAFNRVVSCNKFNYLPVFAR